jgi:hypothetical protein
MSLYWSSNYLKKMRLYNLYAEVILEESRKQVNKISEGVSTNLVDTLLLGDKNQVNIIELKLIY